MIDQATIDNWLVAAAPRVMAAAQQAQRYLLADSLVAGIPNVAIAAGGVLVFTALRPKRRRRSRREAMYGDS
jgi:hypothetical protein